MKKQKTQTSKKPSRRKKRTAKFQSEMNGRRVQSRAARRQKLIIDAQMENIRSGPR